MSMPIGPIDLKSIFPKTIDNVLYGHKVSLWFFYLITIVSIIRSLIHMFKADGGAQSIATIPLDSFTVDGASVIVGIFAYWGLLQFMFGLLQLIIALRYKSLIPLMYLMFS